MYKSTTKMIETEPLTERNVGIANTPMAQQDEIE